MSDNLRLSVSKTKTFVQCKKQFEFSYILKFPKKTHSYHTLGTFCHDVLENFHKTYLEGCLLPNNIVMRDVYKAALVKYKDKMTPEMKKECWVMIDKYLRLISKDKSKANVISVERKFELQVEDITLNGAIDRIQIDDDGVIHVCDYKTSKNKKYLKDDFFQLLTYAFIIISEDPSIKKVRASYIMLRHDFEYITTEFEAEEILKMRDKFLEYARQIRTEKEFTPNPTALCKGQELL